MTIRVRVNPLSGSQIASPLSSEHSVLVIKLVVVVVVGDNVGGFGGILGIVFCCW